MVHEIVIGIVLGATARVTLSALAVAGSVIAQQLGLGFVTAVDPTQGQQGLLIGNFLTILGMTLLFATDSHHLVIAALNESYRIFSPGEMMPSGDVAALATRAFAAAFKIGMQLSAPFLVFGLVFNIGLGVLARLMPAMQVYFVGVPLSIMVGFLIFAFVLTGDDGDLSQLLHRRDARADAAEIDSNNRLRGAAMADDTDDKTEDPTQKRLDDAHAKGDVAKSQEVNTWFIIAGATLVLSTFSGSIGGGILTPLRNLIANAGQLHADGAALLALGNTLGYAVLGAIGVPLLMLMLAAIAGNMIQHRLVWSAESLKPKFSKVSPGAGLQAHLRQAGGGEFRQGRVQADRARRRHDGGAVAGAASAGIVPAVRSVGDPRRHHQSDAATDGRGGGDAGRGRDRRLLLPVPAMVRAAEDVAAGDQGRVQAVRRRPPHQGPRSGSCASSA